MQECLEYYNNLKKKLIFFKQKHELKMNFQGKKHKISYLIHVLKYIFLQRFL